MLNLDFIFYSEAALIQYYIIFELKSANLWYKVSLCNSFSGLQNERVHLSSLPIPANQVSKEKKGGIGYLGRL